MYKIKFYSEPSSELKLYKLQRSEGLNDTYISDGLLGLLLCVSSLLDGVVHLSLQLAHVCIQLPLSVQQTGVLQPNNSI